MKNNLKQGYLAIEQLNVKHRFSPNNKEKCIQKPTTQ